MRRIFSGEDCASFHVEGLTMFSIGLGSLQTMGIDMLPYVGTAILSGTLTYGFVKLFRDSHRRKLLLDDGIACGKAVSEAELKAKHTLDSADFELGRMRLALEEKASQLETRQTDLEHRTSANLAKEQVLADLESKAREQKTVLQGLRTFYAEKLEALIEICQTPNLPNTQAVSREFA